MAGQIGDERRFAGVARAGKKNGARIAAHRRRVKTGEKLDIWMLPSEEELVYSRDQIRQCVADPSALAVQRQPIAVAVGR
jgi:hypothetical protein